MIPSTLKEFVGANGLPIDAADVVKELVETLGEAEDILEAAGWPVDGDFIAGIEALAARPEPLEYDL